MAVAGATVRVAHRFHRRTTALATSREPSQATEKTGSGLSLIPQQTQGAQTGAVTVPLLFSQTELSPFRALTSWRRRRRPMSLTRSRPSHLVAAPRMSGRALSPSLCRYLRSHTLGGRCDYAAARRDVTGLTIDMQRNVHPCRAQAPLATQKLWWSATTWSSATCPSVTRSAESRSARPAVLS